MAEGLVYRFTDGEPGFFVDYSLTALSTMKKWP